MNFDESKTKENLARAFVVETTGGARYQFMAKDAKANGYGFISNILKQIAKNEMAHARVFYDFLLNKGKLGDATDCKNCGYDNIDICFGFPFPNYVMPESLNMESEVELHECDAIYKHFEETALEEGFKEVADAFHHVVQVEHCHHLQLKEIYEKLSQGKAYRMNKINKWKCTNCGTELNEKEVPKNCPMCGYPQGYFMIPLGDN